MKPKNIWPTIIQNTSCVIREYMFQFDNVVSYPRLLLLYYIICYEVLTSHISLHSHKKLYLCRCVAFQIPPEIIISRRKANKGFDDCPTEFSQPAAKPSENYTVNIKELS